MIHSGMQLSVVFTYKFWMGLNGFILLFLAVNIATIGVEIDSRFPFILALGYLVYLFVYLSKNAMWKLMTLFGIAILGIFIYLIGIISGLTGDNLRPLAWTHIVFSLLLLGGAFAHWKSYQSVNPEPSQD